MITAKDMDAFVQRLRAAYKPTEFGWMAISFGADGRLDAAGEIYRVCATFEFERCAFCFVDKRGNVFPPIAWDRPHPGGSCGTVEGDVAELGLRDPHLHGKMAQAWE